MSEDAWTFWAWYWGIGIMLSVTMTLIVWRNKKREGKEWKRFDNFIAITLIFGWPAWVFLAFFTDKLDKMDRKDD